MMYLTQTQTRLTCAASQRDFMRLVWTTAKAMNGSSKGSKAYLKQATAYVQDTVQICTGLYVLLRPQPIASTIGVNPTAANQYQIEFVSSFKQPCHTTTTAKLVDTAMELISFGYFKHSTGFT